MRLAPADYTYWFVREAFDWSVVLQVLWTFDEAPDEAALRDFHARLGASALNRRVVRASVPWARPRWERSDSVPDLALDAAPIPADDSAQWAAEELNTTPLDPETGPTWRLRGATTADGGFVLSLTALHLVADGQAMVSAAVGASTGTTSDPLTGRPSTRVPAVVRDVADAAGQAGSVVVGAVRAARAAFTSASRDQPAAPPVTRPPMHERAPQATPAWATVTVDSEHWATIADAHGGTANTLFVAIIAGALRRAGYAALGEPLKVGIPVSHRADGEEGGNNTAGVSVVLTDEPKPGGDLTGVRAACKDAFRALSAGSRPPLIHLQSLMWLLPLSLVVRVASSGSGMPDAVVSNLGGFPSALASIGGKTANGVAFRGIAQGVDPAEPHRFGDGLQSWLLESEGKTTFAVAAFDEKEFGSDDRLADVLATELSAWGIHHRLW